MDIVQHYRQLVSFDAWANRQIIGSLRTLGTIPPRPLKLMAHVISAEHVWLTRLLHRDQPFPVWPELTLDQCEDEAARLSASWRQYLAQKSADDLEQTVTYKNSKGEAWTSKVQDVLTHVFMHSTYHRGQIAAEIRQAGHAPAYTDFIHGVRQGLVE
jgi:uncharacterized damage-inducible protein DinB